MGDVGDRHLERVVVAEHHHGHRVADQDQVDAGLVDHASAGGVVGGEHHEWIGAVRRLACPNGGHRHLLSHFLPPFPSSALWLPAVDQERSSVLGEHRLRTV